MKLDCGHMGEIGYFTKCGIFCFFCWAKIRYNIKTRKKRRTHEEVVLEKEEKRRIRETKRQLREEKRRI